MSRPQMRLLPVWAVLIVLAAALMSACGSSAYALTVRVIETDGTAIPGASVALMDDQDILFTDKAGQVAWTDVGQEYAILYVSADGYMAHASKVDLERGRNETVILLERAPIEPDVLGP